MKPVVSPASQSVLQAPRRLRILIADDERDSVLMLTELLRDEGHEMRAVYHGADVAAAVADFDPDVVLLDIVLPRASGWEVARTIRARHGEKRPLLIALSGVYKKTSDQLLGQLAGFNHYLVKPYDPAQLLALLRDAQH